MAVSSRGLEVGLGRWRAEACWRGEGACSRSGAEAVLGDGAEAELGDAFDRLIAAADAQA